ncbi:restriction endonuclease subunit S [Halorubrum sp. AD140]|uniref:restriction endonuclease subunit S n=1 Tax=Halorubrum sp. AD140 TaxID=3050073 RepID=UPI002ACC7082|nr:restriction endonuclease subunit S [Halorubrum sp. AD140]MDZ5813214.1 restriction endonuclease subunit S [Halorubrum sp. AD140]
MTSEQRTLSDLEEDSGEHRKPYILRRQDVSKPENWRIYRLGDLLELEYGKSLPEDDREKGPYPVFGSNGRSVWHSDFHIEAPGIIVGRKGVNLGIEWSDDDFNVIDTAYFVNYNSLEVSDVDLRFLYYNLLDFDLDRLKSGSAVPGLNRNDFYEETIVLPPIEEQKKISKILSNIDRKIAVNNRISKLIEDLAQTMFDYRFEHFGPYEELVESEIGEVPAEFEIAEIDDLVWSGRGYSYTSEYLDRDDEIEDSYPMINLKNVKEGGGFRTDEYKYYTEDQMKDRYKIDEGDLVVAITDLTQEGGLIGSPALIPELDEELNIIS